MSTMCQTLHLNALPNENTRKIHKHLGRIYITLAYRTQRERNMGERGKKEK